MKSVLVQIHSMECEYANLHQIVVNNYTNYGTRNGSKKFTKRIPNISDLNYKDRLHSLKLLSLEHRQLIYDLVLCYKNCT